MPPAPAAPLVVAESLSASTTLALAPASLGLKRLLSVASLWGLAFASTGPLVRFLVHDLLRLPADSRAGGALAFFLAEAPRVLLLLVGVVFLVGVVNTYFTGERAQRLLSGRSQGAGTVLAALLGVVTPFCSCSAVPLFIAFVEAGIPLGVTFAFLVSAPMVNEVALVLLFGLFGWRIAALYLMTGLSVAVVAGLVLGRLRLEGQVEDWVREYRSQPVAAVAELSLAQRAAQGAEAARKVVGKTWPYVLAGIGVGSVIHGWVPEGVLAGVMGSQAWWSVPLAVAIGVPMYAGAATLIPVVQALLAKGAAFGTVLAFMMATVGLSLPEFIMLRRVLRPRLLGAFIGVVSVGIVLVGWLFNSLVR